MPIERREILFDYQEMMDIICETPNLKMYLPKDSEKPTIVEAHHTRAFGMLFHEGQRRYGDLHARLAGREAVMLRIKELSMGMDRFEIIGIPDNVLLQTLIAECRKRKIMLARAAQKTIIAADLFIGLQLNFGETRKNNDELSFQL